MREDVHRICEAICAHFRVEVATLLVRDRHKTPAVARQCCMFVARSQLRLSFPKIGQEFGRDHKTVMSACRNIERLLLKNDPRIQAAVQFGVSTIEALPERPLQPVKTVDSPYLDRASGE